MSETGALLDIENLRKLYAVGAAPPPWRKKAPRSYLHAVNDVSFSIARGETVGLVGESGCGKSTLVRLISRLIDPTSGAIRFEAEDIAASPARGFGKSPRRAQIQMVFQDATDSLNPRFTAFRAIADPLMRLRGMSGAALRKRVEQVAEMTGLPMPLLTRFPHQLSGGQKARVGIARAIAVEPRLLILDEPTSALDVSVQVVILKLLEELKERLDLSYLFVSHDLNVVRLLCDRVLVMYLGRIIETGPAEQVFNAPGHPYTRALLSAIPKPGARETRIGLPGEPRSPIDPAPEICPLYGRCPISTDLCHTVAPPRREVAPGQFALCHFAGDKQSAAPAKPSIAAIA
ncbi:MAG TPA: ABC transporter ATP-binding protein [Stellaceae bacterium]|jgi:oligopeptide/dipeptide ABC transporter ATP-binding protein|nr:ABC transporter ATP-binding protein [Stellaceae bacterium]